MTTDYVEDRTETFIGGQDDWLHPDNIQPNQYTAGINVTHRHGVLGPRSGLERYELEFEKGGIVNDKGVSVSWKKIYHQGKFQAQIPYRLGSAIYCLHVISGYLFRTNVDTRKVKVLNPDGPRLNQYKARINWSYAGKFIVLFDFPNYPILVEGTEIRRSDPDRKTGSLETPEVPPAELGAFNQSRLFIADEGNQFTAGDPVGSGIADAPITFAEVLSSAAVYPNQSFSLGTEYADLEITAMAFLQQSDTSVGIGPLLIATENSIHAYQAGNERNTWTKSKFGAEVVHNAGIAGPRAFVNVNQDLWFLSSDGAVRTFSMSRDEQQTWARIPLSNEVHNWLKYWDKSLAQFASLGYYNNKILISANPFRTTALDLNQEPVIDYASAGMVVLNAEHAARLGNGTPPAWDGLWLGVRPMDICTTPDGRCFIMSKDPNSVNRFYELRDDLTTDLIDGKPVYIPARVYLREYDYKDQYPLKENYTADIRMTDLKGDFSINVERKPDHSPNFLPWRSYSCKIPWRECSANPSSMNGYGEHSFRELSLGSPEDTGACDPRTEDLFATFRKQQLRITLQGKDWVLHAVRVLAEIKPNANRVTECEQLPVVLTKKECDGDWSLNDRDGCAVPIT